MDEFSKTLYVGLDVHKESIVSSGGSSNRHEASSQPPARSRPHRRA